MYYKIHCKSCLVKVIMVIRLDKDNNLMQIQLKNLSNIGKKIGTHFWKILKMNLQQIMQI